MKMKLMNLVKNFHVPWSCSLSVVDATEWHQHLLRACSFHAHYLPSCIIYLSTVLFTSQ